MLSVRSGPHPQVVPAQVDLDEQFREALAVARSSRSARHERSGRPSLPRRTRRASRAYRSSLSGPTIGRVTTRSVSPASARRSAFDSEGRAAHLNRTGPDSGSVTPRSSSAGVTCRRFSHAFSRSPIRARSVRGCPDRHRPPAFRAYSSACRSSTGHPSADQWWPPSLRAILRRALSWACCLAAYSSSVPTGICCVAASSARALVASICEAGTATFVSRVTMCPLI